MTRCWSILIVVVLFEQVHQVSTFCLPCRSDQDCHGHCSISSHIPVCDWLTIFIIREHCCLCKAVTCSSDADCSGHSCNSGYVSKCNSQHDCHCERKPSCSFDTDCRYHHCSSGYTATCNNAHCHCHRALACSSDADCSGHSCNSGYVSQCNSQSQCHCERKHSCSLDTDCRYHNCSSGYTATCNNGQCHCQIESTQLTSCSYNSDCAHYHCSSGRTSYCRTTFLNGHCDCLECQMDSDCSHQCPFGFSRKCQNNICDCLNDRASAHCSSNSDCVNFQCSSGHNPVCSLSTQTCHCQATCNTHHDCAHMTCRHGYSVCSAAQNNTKTCVCQSTCSTQDECTNHDCTSHHKSYCHSGQCHCSHQCFSDSYCTHQGFCTNGRPRCSTYLGDICVCYECVHDSECSNFHCQPYHSPICRNDSCSCKADPVDGMWSQWGSWSSCSVTCGPGRQTRARSCTNPAPAHGGLSCIGNSSEEKKCSQVSSCRVDGGWSDWMAWSTCSVSCGGGMHTRARMCSNPVPSNGGSNCVGDMYQTQTCANASCGGLACPTCDNNLVCTFNNTCDSSETCMIRSYHNTRFTVHCSKKEDCAFMKSNLHGEIYCCDDHSCLQRYLGIA